ncbi:glycoside hydrolase family 19 protein [Pantanalinema rosaneae CENA516]|uniref:glycoside hydrolase family 19 protein n=1 Tax=Pantanalinema rosaneae TaxID=1620701 RepID=UPI003D6FD5D1
MSTTTAATTVNLIMAVEQFRNLTKQKSIIQWLQDSTGDQKQQQFTQLWRDGQDGGSISFVDVFKYYKGLPHQQAALRWLQENSQPQTLTEFFRRWNEVKASKIDRAAFFTKFGVSQSKQHKYDVIFDYWEDSPYDDLRWLAYALATAYHETGSRMEPVREGFAETDEEAIAAVRKWCQQQGIPDYAKVDPVTGKSYFGRGLVQITHADNYKKLGQALGMGMALYYNPSLALDPEISVKIMFKGMVDGLFRSPHKLSRFFNSSTTDWFNARGIINGDKNYTPDWANGQAIGALIADYAKDFYRCLQ